MLGDTSSCETMDSGAGCKTSGSAPCLCFLHSLLGVLGAFFKFYIMRRGGGEGWRETVQRDSLSQQQCKHANQDKKSLLK